MVKTQRVVITPGEPAGIGPDLVVQLAQREWPVELVVCADATLLTNRAAMLGLPLTLRPYSPNSPANCGHINATSCRATCTCHCGAVSG